MAANLTYTIPMAVQYMHDKIPRFDARQGMKQVTNTFGADIMGADMPYFTAVLSVAGAYFAIGILSFLIFGLIYLSYACCRPKFRQLPKPGCCSRLAGCLFAPRLWYLAAGLIMLGGASACLAVVTEFRKATGSAVDAVTAATSALNGASGDAGQLVGALALVNASLASVVGSPSFAGADAGWAAAVSGSYAGVSGMLTSVGATAQQIGSLNASVNATLRTGTFDLGALGTRVWLGGIIVLAVFLGWVVTTLFGLLGTKGGACWHRTWSACGLVLTTLAIFLFAGFFAAIATVGSDVCVAPSPALLSIARAVGANGTTRDTLGYYTTCGAPGAVVAPVGLAFTVQSLSPPAADLRTSVLASNTSVGGTPALAWAAADMNAAAAHMRHAGMVLTSLTSRLECAPVYGIYASALNALCGEGIVASIKTWGLATAACVLVYVLVSAGARLCWTHTGDPLDPADEDKVAPDLSAAGLPTTAPAPRGAAPQLMYVPAAGYGGQPQPAGGAAAHYA